MLNNLQKGLQTTCQNINWVEISTTIITIFCTGIVDCISELIYNCCSITAIIINIIITDINCINCINCIVNVQSINQIIMIDNINVITNVNGIIDCMNQIVAIVNYSIDDATANDSRLMSTFGRGFRITIKIITTTMATVFHLIFKIAIIIIIIIITIVAAFVIYILLIIQCVSSHSFTLNEIIMVMTIIVDNNNNDDNQNRVALSECHSKFCQL